MKIYLVGGAVRDRLLNLTVHEKDWVVVGATPQHLLEQGFKQVGKDFPVFLHPETGEEYALARMERKTGRGYHGFQFEFSPEVTLEEDLLRRDLTINAIAENAEGHLIDPYGGLGDLKNRLLRHVSPAFVEDPLRLLRVARFAARLAPLGFRVAPETERLLRQMARAGELRDLTSERVWNEWIKLLSAAHPHAGLLELRRWGALKLLFPEWDALFGIPHPTTHRRPTDVGMSLVEFLRVAPQENLSTESRCAGLWLHAATAMQPYTQWFETPPPSRAPLDQLAKRYTLPKTFFELSALCLQHPLPLQPLKEKNYSALCHWLEQLDAFRRPQRFLDYLNIHRIDCMQYQEPAPFHDALRQLQVLFEAAQCVKLSEEDQKNSTNGLEIKEKIRTLRMTALEQRLSQSTLMGEKKE